MNKAKLPSCLRKYASIIESVSDERDSGDGIWVYLAKGLRDSDGETHCIHEETLRECVFQLERVVRCTEPGCCD